MLLSQAPASIKNTVGSNSGRMPKPKMVLNLLAPPDHEPCRAYNGRAKSNHANVKSTSDEYDGESNRGKNIEVIKNYGYSTDKARSSLASPGNSGIAIPIQVCEGEFRSRPSISSKCSFPFSSRLSNEKSSKDAQNKVKMKMLSTRIQHRADFFSAAAPVYCTNMPSWIDKECYAPSASTFIVASIHNENSNSESPNKHTISTDVAYSKQSPTFAKSHVKILNNALTSSCEGDHEESKLSATHPMLASTSNDYCCMASKNVAMRHRLNCEGDRFHFYRPIHHLSVSIDSAASNRIKQAPISALASRSPGVSTKSQLYCCVAISNNLSTSAFEGDAQKQLRFLTARRMSSSLVLIVVLSNYCRVASSNQTMHHKEDYSKSQRPIDRLDQASASADRIKQAASRKMKGKGLVLGLSNPSLYCEGDFSQLQQSIFDRASATTWSCPLHPAECKQINLSNSASSEEKDEGLVHLAAIEIRHPIHYMVKSTYHEEYSQYPQSIYVQEFMTRMTSYHLDQPKRIKSAPELSPQQNRHRKAIPTTLNPSKLSSSSLPSVWEGEAPARVGLFQLTENKTEDCESRIEQVDQNADESEKEIMQAKFRHHNYFIDCHANCPSRSYLPLPLFYYVGNSIPHRESSWLPRETPMSISAITIQFRCQEKFPQAASAASAATAEKLSAASLAAALTAKTMATLIAITTKINCTNASGILRTINAPRRECNISSKSANIPSEIYQRTNRPNTNISGQSKSNHSYLRYFTYLSTYLWYIRSCQRSYLWHEIFDISFFHVHRVSNQHLLRGTLVQRHLM